MTKAEFERLKELDEKRAFHTKNGLPKLTKAENEEHTNLFCRLVSGEAVEK